VTHVPRSYTLYHLRARNSEPSGAANPSRALGRGVLGRRSVGLACRPLGGDFLEQVSASIVFDGWGWVVRGITVAIETIGSVLHAKGLKSFCDRRSLAPELPWVLAQELRVIAELFNPQAKGDGEAEHASKISRDIAPAARVRC